MCVETCTSNNKVQGTLQKKSIALTQFLIWGSRFTESLQDVPKVTHAVL